MMGDREGAYKLLGSYDLTGGDFSLLLERKRSIDAQKARQKFVRIAVYIPTLGTELGE